MPMHATQAEKAKTFQALHARAGAFVIPNPWDAGTARLLTRFGFEALTTTSAGLAFTLGRHDGDGSGETPHCWPGTSGGTSLCAGLGSFSPRARASLQARLSMSS